jgi:ankyrin repeat protein
MKRWLAVLALLLGGCNSSTPPAAPESVVPAVSSAQAEAEAELKTYFFEAARQGDQVLIDEYVKSGFPVDVRTPQGYTALILAAYHGHKEAVQRLIVLGADPCARDNRGSTALMGATFKGEFAVVRLLLDQACTQANDRNRDGQTAAMYAALSGNGKLIEMLRQRGANLALHDQDGHTAASLARQQGAEEVARQIERQ